VVACDRSGAAGPGPGPLHAGPDELPGVLPGHLADLGEYRVDVAGELPGSRFPTPGNIASVAELALDVTGLACGFAGFTGDAPVLAGAAGTAGRQLVVYPGNLLPCPRQGGGRSRDPPARLPRAFELFAGIKYLAVQAPGAFRRPAIDLGLLPPDKRGSAFERGLAAVKALPAF